MAWHIRKRTPEDETTLYEQLKKISKKKEMMKK